MRLDTIGSSKAIMLTEAPKPHRYLALDALRGAAALAVVFYHLRTLRPDDPLPLFANGYLAVDFFFALSGFVITHAYAGRLHDGMPWTNFMMARLIRLQPTMVIGTLIGFALAITQRILGLDAAPGLYAIATSLPANLAMLPNLLVPWGIFLFNPPAWSLFYELVANAIYAAGIRQAAKHRLNAKFQSSLLVCIWAIGLAGVTFHALAGTGLDRGVVLADWPVATSRIAFSFTTGVLLHALRRHWTRHLPRLPVAVLLVMCLVLLALDPPLTWRPAYEIAFVLIASPMLVMLGSIASPEQRTAKAYSWLGAISYPLYAIHAPIKHVVQTVLPLDAVTMLMLCFSITVATAWCIAAIVDLKLQNLLQSRAKHHSALSIRAAPVAEA